MRWLVGLAAVLTSLAVGCQTTAPAAPTAAATTAPASNAAVKKPTTPAEIAAYRGSDRQKVLEDGARAEGKLVWYTSLAGPIIDRLFDGFKQKYPFIETEVFRGAETDIVTRATQEAQAGKQVFDAVESPPTAVRLLADANLLTPYFSPALDGVGDTFKTPASSGLVESATVRVQFIGFGYNTSLIPADAAPKKTEDLMNPALSGKIGIAGTTTGKKWVGSVLKAMGEDKGKQWLMDFAAKQKPVVHQISGKALMDLIAKGEVAASPTIFEAELLQLVKGENVPAKWVPLKPVVGNAGQAGVALKAPHPYAAMLFTDYLLTDGKKVLQDNYYFTPGQSVAFSPWIPEQGRTTAEIEKDAEHWNDVFNTVFRKT